MASTIDSAVSGCNPSGPVEAESLTPRQARDRANGPRHFSGEADPRSLPEYLDSLAALDGDTASVLIMPESGTEAYCHPRWRSYVHVNGQWEPAD